MPPKATKARALTGADRTAGRGDSQSTLPMESEATNEAGMLLIFKGMWKCGLRFSGLGQRG